MTQAAAFFDLDRTLIRRSSVLALAPAFRSRGIISRLDLAKSALWQLLFAARGASAERVRSAAEDGMRILRGFSVEEMQRLVGDAMEPVLRPLVYAEPLRLVQGHRERGERVYVVSATLQEIVEHIADDLGFDGAVGSTCEIVDGVYTGRTLRAAHGAGKARALRELAEAQDIDLVASTAYSDSYTDIPFLEAVGHPVAVNPDRKLRRVARQRGGPRCASPTVRPEDAHARLAALGFSPAEVETLAAHFLDAERRGQGGHGLSRIEWLETWDELPLGVEPELVVDEPGYQRWDGHDALGYLTLAAAVEAQIARPPERARVVVCRRTFPTGSLGYWVGLLAEAGLVAVLTATSPRRLASPAGGEPLAGTNPLAVAVPSSDGRPLVADVSMGAVTYGEVLAGTARAEELVPFGGPLAHKSFALAVGLHALVDALAGGDGFGAVLVVAQPEADPVPALRDLADGVRLPGDGR